MPTAVDDLKKGMYVAIVGRKDDPPRDAWSGQARSWGSWDGQPLRIVAISLPFVLCEGVGERFASLDIRIFEVQQLDRRYAEHELWEREQPEPKRRKRKREERDSQRCINCGNRMIQKMQGSKDGAERRWFYYCDECKKLGDPV